MDKWHVRRYASVPDELWNACVDEFGVDGTHNLLVSICAFNEFNRVSIATRTGPERIEGANEFDLDRGVGVLLAEMRQICHI